MNIPCITVRNSTERPETIDLGTNELVGDDLTKLEYYIDLMIAGKWKTGKVPEKWDGKAGERIANKLCQICNL